MKEATLKRRQINVGKTLEKEMQDYADKYCEGNWSQAARKLIEKSLNELKKK